MKTNDIKKGMNIKTGQLGTPVSGVMLDNQRGNRRLVDVNGSEVGLFDDDVAIVHQGVSNYMELINKQKKDK